MQHCNARSIGIHLGTLDLTNESLHESLDEQPKDLALARAAKKLAQEAFDVMAIGQTLKLPRRKALHCFEQFNVRPRFFEAF